MSSSFLSSLLGLSLFGLSLFGVVVDVSFGSSVGFVSLTTESVVEGVMPLPVLPELLPGVLPVLSGFAAVFPPEAPPPVMLPLFPPERFYAVSALGMSLSEGVVIFSS